MNLHAGTHTHTYGLCILQYLQPKSIFPTQILIISSKMLQIYPEPMGTVLF